jgi:ssDNA-binding Zn-finger/Zn-ribbon topoisomerase 1
MECAQCGKSELKILRHRIGSVEQDKVGLIKLTHDLQDRIAELEKSQDFRMAEAYRCGYDAGREVTGNE